MHRPPLGSDLIGREAGEKETNNTKPKYTRKDQEKEGSNEDGIETEINVKNVIRNGTPNQQRSSLKHVPKRTSRSSWIA